MSAPSCFLHFPPAPNDSLRDSVCPSYGITHHPAQCGSPPVAYTSPQTPYHPAYDAYMSYSHTVATLNCISHGRSPPYLPSQPLQLSTAVSYPSTPSFTRQDEVSPYAILYRIHSIYL